MKWTNYHSCLNRNFYLSESLIYPSDIPFIVYPFSNKKYLKSCYGIFGLVVIKHKFDEKNQEYDSNQKTLANVCSYFYLGKTKCAYYSTINHWTWTGLDMLVYFTGALRHVLMVQQDSSHWSKIRLTNSKIEWVDDEKKK